MQFIVSYHTELPVGTVEVNGFCDSDDTSISLTARDAIGWACWCWCCNYWSEFASVSDGRRRSISWRRHIDWKTNQASDSAHGLVLTLVSQFGYTQCQIRVATCRVTLSMLLLCVACFFLCKHYVINETGRTTTTLPIASPPKEGQAMAIGQM